MKNEQQPAKNTGKQPDESQQQKSNDSAPSSQEKMDKNQPSSSQKTNISVDNDGKIGKAHDQWDNNNNNRNENENQDRNDKTIKEPGTDASMHDPEKTAKKMPSMESNKNSK